MGLASRWSGRLRAAHSGAAHRRVGTYISAIQSMRIEPLARSKHLISSIASRLHAEWGDLPPWDTQAKIQARLEEGASESIFPHTLVGIDHDGAWTSTGSVKLRELSNHPDKQHWIGEIFVLPEHRGRGLGSKLTRSLTEYALSHGAAQLFLYTPDQQSLYRRLGWREVSQEIVHNELVSIMTLLPRTHHSGSSAA